MLRQKQDRVISNTTKQRPTPNGTGQPSLDSSMDTYNTEKMTVFFKKDLLERVRNFAYWDRYSVTEALNQKSQGDTTLQLT